MTRTFDVVVRNDGLIEHLHDDIVTQITAPLGAVTTPRASHVDAWCDLSQKAQVAWQLQNPDRPAPVGVAWFVDLSPLKGGVFGPFALREAALTFERDWISQNYLSKQDHSANG